MSTTTTMKSLQNLPRPTTVLALLFALISGVTAFQGASLFCDNNFVAVVFAIAVQGSVFFTETSLVANLSASKPEKSVVFLFMIFLFFLFIGSGLNAMLFFHIQGATVAARNAKVATGDVWSKSRQELESYRQALQQSLQTCIADNQAALAEENQKIAGQRLSGVAPDIAGRERLRAEKKELDRTIAAADKMTSLPLTPPAPKAEAERQLANAFREASDVFVGLPESARRSLPTLHPLPLQEPSADFMDLFVMESFVKSSPTARLAWALGAGTESLAVIILLVGMPGIPWALRIRSRKHKIATLVRELVRTLPSPEKMGTLPFLIEELSLSGTLELVGENDLFTADELEPSLRALEESIATNTGQRVKVIGLRTHSGTAIRLGIALRPQLAGQPLHLEVVAGGAGAQL